MQEITQLHRAFNHIRYFDQDHTYIDTNTGEQLTSCTTFIKKFEYPFPKEYQLKQKSKEYGCTESELEAQWDKQRIIGSSRGTILHGYLERLWFGKEYPVEYPTYIQNLPTVDFVTYHRSLDTLKKYSENFINDHPNLIPVRLELILGDSELGIAGTMDGLFFDTDEDCLAQIDIKTDKAINLTNKYQNYKKPITKLPQCNMSKYQIQLSIYRYILEKNTDLKIGYSNILWMNFKNDNYEVIPTNYLKAEVEAMFNYSK